MNSVLSRCPQCGATAHQYPLSWTRVSALLSAARARVEDADQWTLIPWWCVACGCPYLTLTPTGLTRERWAELSGLTPKNHTPNPEGV